ncbi:hypothetical protein [Streptosporangium roseum]|uniref:hypothetical protein n=1 Tax=Streptosporangium roseum TaxID=2001 RepID=UPI0012DC6898|nr:hypothetical protein [Streptosporangium roseum]
MIVVITIAVQRGLSDHRKAGREDRRADRRGAADSAGHSDHPAQSAKRSRDSSPRP